MDIQSAYNKWSEIYDENRNLTRDLDHEVTVKILKSQKVDSLLELGCGTGKNTPFYCDISGEVRALDFSSAMLARARDKLSSTLKEKVVFEECDLTAFWPVEDKGFDLIVSNLVMEHIEDLDHIFHQARRALRKAGAFFLSEYHPFRQYQGKSARFDHSGGVVSVSSYVHHLTDFTNAAQKAGFVLEAPGEWWHQEDIDSAPRLLTLLFRKKDIQDELV